MEDLRGQIANMKESRSAPTATTAAEDNTYDYVYDVPDLTPRPKEAGTTPRQTGSTIR